MLRPGRLSGSLPLSVAVHFVAIVLLLIIPLMAEVTLPFFPTVQAPQTYIAAIPVPPAVIPHPTPPNQVVTASHRDAAPTEAPSAINPERERSEQPVPDLPLGDDTAPPGTIGAVVDGSVRLTPVPLPLPKPTGPIRVSELLQSPKKIVDMRPVYPDVARQARIEGTVILEAVLDRNGRVDQVRVVKSVPLLDPAALDAVRQWRYTPSVLNGQPVAVLMTVTIRFTLQ